jgi:HAE1 family hydrophobic/amphiphilic exporter-1
VQELYASAGALQQTLEGLPQLRDVTSDLQLRNPAIRVAIDRNRAAAFGVSPSQIESALYDAYGAAQASTILTDNNQYWVIIELLPQYQRDLRALRLLSVRSSNGTLVPLTALARLTEGLGPLAVNHAGQLPSVTLSFNTAPNVSLGDAVAAVQRAAAGTLPAGITSSFSGTAQAFQAAQQGLVLLLVLAIAVIYIVLGILYECFVHPLTISRSRRSESTGGARARPSWRPVRCDSGRS